MTALLSDHQSLCIAQGRIALNTLLAELNEMRKHFTAEAETARDQALLELVDDAFSSTYAAITDLRLILEFADEPALDKPH